MSSPFDHSDWIRTNIFTHKMPYRLDMQDKIAAGLEPAMSGFAVHRLNQFGYATTIHESEL